MLLQASLEAGGSLGMHMHIRIEPTSKFDTLGHEVQARGVQAQVSSPLS